MMTDLHNHTRYSHDSEAEPQAMFERAEELGLDYFGLSEHVDLEYAAAPEEVVHDFGEHHADDYFQYMIPMRDSYAGNVKLLVGIEFGFNPRSDMSEYVRIGNEYGGALDYVINSVHAAEGVECYWAENLEKFSKRESYGKYLTAVLESLDAPYRYEIIGHIGYVCRNAPYPDPVMRYAEFPDLLDAIFQKMIEKDVSLELNTSSRDAGSLFLPNAELLKRYRELGGEHVTFGSDAHAPARIGDRYVAVCEALRAVGIRYTDVFIRRERKKIKL